MFDTPLSFYILHHGLASIWKQWMVAYRFCIPYHNLLLSAILNEGMKVWTNLCKSPVKLRVCSDTSISRDPKIRENNIRNPWHCLNWMLTKLFYSKRQYIFWFGGSLNINEQCIWKQEPFFSPFWQSFPNLLPFSSTNEEEHQTSMLIDNDHLRWITACISMTYFGERRPPLSTFPSHALLKNKLLSMKEYYNA